MPSSKLTIVPEQDIPPTLRPNASEIEDDDSEMEYMDSDKDDIDEGEDEDLYDEEEDDIDDLPDSQDSEITIVEEDNEEEKETYQDKVDKYRAKIEILEGTQVLTRTNRPRRSILWTIVREHDGHSPTTSNDQVGLRPQVLNEIIESTSENNCIAAEVFLRFMFGNAWLQRMTEKLVLMNGAVQTYNAQSSNKRPHKMFTKSEFLKGLGLFIGAVCYAAKGEGLWKKDSDELFMSLEPTAEFQKYMRDYRFREWRSYIPFFYKDAGVKDSDPWWEFVTAVNDFNHNRLELLIPSNHLCIDECMSAWRPRKTDTGKLPNLTHIPRKPEPLGSEFKCTACSQTGCMLNLEIQKGKEAMKSMEHNRALGSTAGCTLRLAQERLVHSCLGCWVCCCLFVPISIHI